jgi:hypothetical protein
MDARLAFLDLLKRGGLAKGKLLGLLHLLIGRRVLAPDGSLLSPGLTWRETASLLRRARWDREAVRELGIDPAALPPRDRERFWYAAIAQAHVDSPEAVRAGDDLAEVVRAAGYAVAPAPSLGRDGRRSFPSPP